MDHPQRDMSREQQQNDHLEVSLSIPYTDGSEAGLSTVDARHQQSSYSQQDETQLKETQVVQDFQAQRHEVKQTQQSQKTQKQEDHGKILHQSQEAAAHHNKEQHVPTSGQAHQSLSSSEQHQKSQKHPQKLQPSAKDQQEQQIKKLKKKLVGENQERINFLIQASQAMALTADSSGGVTGQWALAAQVGSLASAVGRRCVLRLTPALKRGQCKGCGTALVYGLNARVRHRSRRQKHLVVTCLTCHTIKRFINDPKHKLWFEQEEALA